MPLGIQQALSLSLSLSLSLPMGGHPASAIFNCSPIIVVRAGNSCAPARMYAGPARMYAGPARMYAGPARMYAGAASVSGRRGAGH